MVGAGAVVTKDFESDCLIGGNPAKVIKKLASYKASEPAGKERSQYE